jgi:hypothetical protein
MHAARAGLLVAGALVCAACARVQALPSQVADWFDLSRPHLTSFLGVRFGETLARAQRELPGGTVETSPYGADAYRIENVQADTIRYDAVVYEFSGELGMQLAIATFPAASAGEVLRGLEGTLGAPTVARPRAGTGAQTLVASWDMAHGERALFLGPERRVVMLGPAGSTLRPDVILRPQPPQAATR